MWVIKFLKLRARHSQYKFPYRGFDKSPCVALPHLRHTANEKIVFASEKNKVFSYIYFIMHELFKFNNVESPIALMW